MGKRRKNSLLHCKKCRIFNLLYEKLTPTLSEFEILKNEILKLSEPEDLLGFGLIPEFVGRLPIISSLEELSTEQLVKKMQINENKPINLIPLLIDFKDVKYLKFI